MSAAEQLRSTVAVYAPPSQESSSDIPEPEKNAMPEEEREKKHEIPIEGDQAQKKGEKEKPKHDESPRKNKGKESEYMFGAVTKMIIQDVIITASINTNQCVFRSGMVNVILVTVLR